MRRDMVRGWRGGGPSVVNGMLLIGHGFEMFYLSGKVSGGLVAYGLP